MLNVNGIGRRSLSKLQLAHFGNKRLFTYSSDQLVCLLVYKYL